MAFRSSVDKFQSLKTELLEIDSAKVGFTLWYTRTRSAFVHAFGENHYLTKQFTSISWSSMNVFADDSTNAQRDRQAFFDGRRLASEYMDAAIAELEDYTAPEVIADATAYDPELWSFIEKHVHNQDWVSLATQTNLFVEDRIRKWAGRPPEEIGDKLMTAVFGDKGDYRLGLTDGEKQGWHRFAMGIAMALRNADAHRIQTRADHKTYALGVLGAGSLLLTQLRYEHGNRFQDLSPANADN